MFIILVFMTLYVKNKRAPLLNLAIANSNTLCRLQLFEPTSHNARTGKAPGIFQTGDVRLGAAPFGGPEKRDTLPSVFQPLNTGAAERSAGASMR